MVEAEKVLIAALLFAGFLWIRSRSRKLGEAGKPSRALIGVYILLPALLIGEKLLFDQWPLRPWAGLLLKALVLPATFLAIGLVFLRKGEPAHADAAG